MAESDPDVQIARTQRIADNDATFVDPQDLLAELRDDKLAQSIRAQTGLETGRRGTAATVVVPAAQ
jgi:hypothetical protein